MTTLNLSHDWGFFSCCSVRLHYIIQYFNNEGILPDDVDSTFMFEWYKINTCRDITFDYFN